MADYHSQHTGNTIDTNINKIPAIEGNILSLNTSIQEEATSRQTNDDTIINRLRGETTIADDPFHFKSFNNPTGVTDDTADREAAAWLAEQYTTDPAVKQAPVGILRICINGSYVLCINNVLNYATGVWTQTLLNAKVNTNGGIGSSTGIYVRESSLVNGVVTWGAWQKIGG